jgi:hypothetical protein
MRVLMGVLFVLAALAAVIGLGVALYGAPAHRLIAAPVAAVATIVVAVLGVGAILEDEAKQARALLRDIRDRLPRS